MENTFKVNDLVIGIDESRYNVTNDKAICRVVESSGGGMRIVLLKRLDEKYFDAIGKVFIVSSRYFKLYTEGWE